MQYLEKGKGRVENSTSSDSIRESPVFFATEARQRTPGLRPLSLLSTSSPSPIGISYASNNHHHLQNTKYSLHFNVLFIKIINQIIIFFPIGSSNYYSPLASTHIHINASIIISKGKPITNF